VKNRVCLKDRQEIQSKLHGIPGWVSLTPEASIQQSGQMSVCEL
jgi:hypothetical protein